MKIVPRVETSFIYVLWLGLMIILFGCKEDPELAKLSTSGISDITVNTALSGGNITSDGGAEIMTRGVCWNTTSEPKISGSHTNDNQGDGLFQSNLTGLSPDTQYYVRAFATNEAGTAYGNEVSFRTLPLVVPVLTTSEVTGITSSSAISGGNISSDGGAAVSARGVCWSVTVNPTINDNKIANGTGTGNYTANISGLSPGTLYHIRAYATNSVGTSYGNDLTFTTLAVTPVLTTTSISSITRTSAVSGGNISSNGGAPVTARGICWSTSPGPTVAGTHSSDGTGDGIFTSNLTALTPDTRYYVRAYATNSAGTSYGNEQSFLTDPVLLPTVTTNSVTSISLNSALSGGNILSDNGSSITARGVCWNINGNPTLSDPKTSDGLGTGNFSSTLTGLDPGTVYYVRAYASNSAGTGYGEQIRFTTSISDIDGNIYRTVIIGNQMWMKSDLKTTRYNDNTLIPNVQDPAEWIKLNTPGYCWYNNDPANGSTYGILYNWYTVLTDKLCPSSWHVPTDSEFNIMELSLGMPTNQIDEWGWRGTDQGAQMKSETGWNGTNASGYSGIPGGYRFGLTGEFFGLGILTYWWTATEDGLDNGWYRRLDGTETRIYKASTSKWGGKFVRCIKN